ncbi:MAG TPA: 1,4-dihydroxy-2-naphthoate polyprenyltransferase [Acidimicrobiia bacterium]|nr:1,4-dihydroxy-2-naphthoate polyprenyltransferase [Acidimicrobiia bacterium]
MTTASQWVQGARPATLGAAIAPVLVGTAAGALASGDLIWWRAVAALIVALALQVGVNYANDYADGVKGTDRDRRGPLRLTATGTAQPNAVKRAAFASFGIAALVGAVLSIVVNPWLLALGVAAIAAGWFYSGGSRPYGYSGWGEVAVLVFFGFGACAGSAYVQVLTVPAAAWWGSLVVGLPACAVLLANNIRDVETDRAAGKRTLAVRIGPGAARRVFVACVITAFAAVVPIALGHPITVVAGLAIPFAIRPVSLVLTRHDPPSLVIALLDTVRLELVLGAFLAAGLALS